MIIKKMTASFGRLDKAQLTPQDGLNIIHAPNEGGKSTWCAFIRAMFYGIPTRDRDKKGYLAEKNRYQPWSGSPMEGEMTLEWKGRDITLRRFSKGSAPFSGFSAVYSDTQLPVPELTAQNCGEVLLGVGREVWERSAFIGSAPSLAIDGTPELERRIAALFSSGQEDVSFSQTQARLREWQRRRQHNKSGLIPKLEDELAGTDRILGQLQAAGHRLARIREQRPALEEQLRELEDELQLHRRLSRRDLNARYAQALEEQNRLRALTDSLLTRQSKFGPLPHRDRLRDAQTQLQRLTVQEEALTEQGASVSFEPLSPPSDPRFSGLDGTQAVRLAQDERAQAEALSAQAHEKKNQRRRHIQAGLGSFAGALLGGIASGHVLVGLLGGAALSILLVLILQGQNKAETIRLQAQAQAILDRWEASTPQQITEAAERYRQQMEAFARAQEERSHARTQLEIRLNALEQASAELLAFVRSFAPQVNALPDCSAVLSEALELEDRLRECRDRLDLSSRRCDDLKSQGAQVSDTPSSFLTPEHTPEQTQLLLSQTKAALAELDRQEAMTKGELLTLGDRTQLEARQAQLLAQLERRQKEYQALELALDSLQQANSALQERFAPELNRRSGEILSALTNARYTAMTLDREFSACARGTDSLLPRSSLSLSRGTADQLYLAVRLAVCQLCLPDDDPSPLVLDDALLTFDDERMALALDYLSKTGRQVLLFSCQQRESRLGLGKIRSLQS